MRRRPRGDNARLERNALACCALKLGAKRLDHWPERRIALDQSLDTRLCPLRGDQACPNQRHGDDNVAMVGFNIAPAALVGLVSDPEIIDAKFVGRSFSDILKEQEFSGACRGGLIISEPGKVADQPVADDA